MKFYAITDSRVSIFERGYLYGDGLFDTMRSYNGEIFRFEDHFERLNKNAHALGINPVPGLRKLKALVLTALKKNRLKDAYIRVSLSRGQGVGPKPVKGVKPCLSIIVRPSKVYPLRLYDKGAVILIGSRRRISPCALDGKIKSMNYLNSILARATTGTNAFETILLSEEGYVTEGASSNIFIVRGNKLITPPSFLSVLEGITRKVVLEIAERLGIATELSPFTSYDVYTAEEAFLTNTGIEVMPVRMVDGRIIGDSAPGEITCAIREKFLGLIKRKEKK